MEKPSSGRDNSLKILVERVNRWAVELNALLIVLAVGLAVLDATCFTAMRIVATGSIPDKSAAEETSAIVR